MNILYKFKNSRLALKNMYIYCVYKNKSDSEDLKYIRKSTSFYAGFFDVLWLIYNRLWKYTLIFLCLKFTAYFLIQNSNIPNIIFNIANFIFFYIFASDILEHKFANNNFDLYDIIYANNEEEAELKHIMRQNNINKLGELNYGNIN